MLEDDVPKVIAIHELNAAPLRRCRIYQGE